jgi:RimJ/RimL family protein N-acetyltransferase
VLRPLTARDFEALLAVLDEEVVRWQGYPSDRGALREMALQWASGAGKPRPGGRQHYDWAICERRSGELVGARSIAVYVHKRQGLVYETGSNLKAGWRGQGYGTEEVSAMLRLARDHLGYGTAYAGTDPANLRAVHLYKRCGFHCHGRGDAPADPERLRAERSAALSLWCSRRGSPPARYRPC